MHWAGSDRFATLPGLLQYTLDATSNSAAFNWREAGYWRRLSTEEFAGQVRRFALGLVDLGLRPGDTLGILAPPSPFWLVADFAAMSIGVISVPLFPNMSPEHLAWEADNSSLRMLVVIGEPQWQLARPLARRFQKVITKGVHADRGHWLDWQGLLEHGDALAAREPTRYADLRDAVGCDDVATIIHTSGSTGKPKGVALTHRNLVTQVVGAAACFPLDPARDRALSCLPLAHVFERMVMYLYVATGLGVYFCDDIKNLGPMLREVKPTVVTMVPRLVEKLHARILGDIDAGGPMKRSLGHWALERADHRAPETSHSWSDGVAESILYRKVRAALGGNLRYCIVGGAALADDLARFLTNVGVPVYVGYGLTECAPVAAVNRPGAARIGTVGKPFPGVEVRIGAQDEILVRGANVMKGYHRDETATAATVDAQGWLHTGDCGRFDADGYLIITGRIKELLKTSNGKYVCPVPIEQALMAHPLVEQAMVIADGRNFVSALLFANPEALHRARLRDVGETLSDAAYAASPAVNREIDSLLATINAGLDHWEQVRRWRLVTTMPTVEGNELTPTLKIRRHVVAQVHAALIEAMYRDEPGAAPLSGGTPRGESQGASLAPS